jgi:hypothetical protein
LLDAIDRLKLKLERVEQLVAEALEIKPALTGVYGGPCPPAAGNVLIQNPRSAIRRAA